MWSQRTIARNERDGGKIMNKVASILAFLFVVVVLFLASCGAKQVDVSNSGLLSLFGSTERTLGGPGIVSGRCGTTHMLFRGSGLGTICVTFQNMSKCVLKVVLREDIHNATTIAYIDPDTSQAVCGKIFIGTPKGKDVELTENIVRVTCSAGEECPNKRHKYVWRVDHDRYLNIK